MTETKVLLVGNPNVGKSLVFSRITGIGVISANYCGVTVGVKTGKFKHADHEYELADAPGVYSFEAFSKAEEAALDLVDKADIVVNVIDATNLERNLNLTLQLLKKAKPTIVCLNFWDETAHKGISIDASELGKTLGVPVVTTSALSGEGISNLVAQISDARISSFSSQQDDPWSQIGSITERVQTLRHRHHTPLEALSDFTLHPLGGLVSAAIILAATFLIVRSIGEGLLNYVCDPLFSLYHPLILRAASLIPVEFLKEVLVGRGPDPLGSFGILTTGVYIALVLVFPYFFAFYLLFGILEDTGYLPRLTVVLDSLFHRMGLHGYSAIPVMLGLGCKVPALLATRLLANQNEKILTIILILMSAPCLPQSAMIVSLGMQYGAWTVVTVFVVLAVLAFAASLLLSKRLKGEAADLFIEIPPYRSPSVRLMASKLWLRIAEYFREVFPMIIVGVLVINLLEFLTVIDWISRIIGKPIAGLLSLPKEIASVMILGFLRKDVSIAMLAPFGLTGRQFVVAAIFMVLYMPCIASFFTLLKETGPKTTLKIVMGVFACALAIAAVLNQLLSAAGWG